MKRTPVTEAQTLTSSTETRIRALIRLSRNNDNPHEAASAYAKAKATAAANGWSVVSFQLIFKPGLRAVSPEEVRWRAFGYVKVGRPIRKTTEHSAVYGLGGKEHWIPNLYVKVIDGMYFAPKKILGVSEPDPSQWKDPT